MQSFALFPVYHPNPIYFFFNNESHLCYLLYHFLLSCFVFYIICSHSGVIGHYWYQFSFLSLDLSIAMSMLFYLHLSYELSIQISFILAFPFPQFILLLVVLQIWAVIIILSLCSCHIYWTVNTNHNTDMSSFFFLLNVKFYALTSTF